MIKWAKQAPPSNAPDTLYAPDIHAVKTALDIVNKWNASGVIDIQIRINVPEVWRLSDSSPIRAGAPILVEPFIDDFCKCSYSRYPARARVT